MRNKPDYAALNDEKRDQLREGRAVWRNAAEEIATLLRLVASNDTHAGDASAKADDILEKAREATKRGKNGS